VPGLIGAMAAEMLVYLATTGDPLLRYRLALGHVGVPSAELPAGFDTRRSPLFNPAYITAWKREQGIAVHWSIDAWLNLVASPRLGRTLLGTAIIVLLARSVLPKPSRRTVALIVSFALLVSVLLIYGLAIDPKSRMFLLLGAACSIALAAAAVAAWRGSRQWIPGAILALLVLINGRTLTQLPSTAAAEARARQWIAAHPNDVEMDATTLSSLTLIAGAHALPPEHSGKPLRIISTKGTCADLVRSSPTVRASVVEAAPTSLNGDEICLLRLDRPATGPAGPA